MVGLSSRTLQRSHLTAVCQPAGKWTAAIGATSGYPLAEQDRCRPCEKRIQAHCVLIACPSRHLLARDSRRRSMGTRPVGRNAELLESRNVTRFTNRLRTNTRTATHPVSRVILTRNAFESLGELGHSAGLQIQQDCGTTFVRYMRDVNGRHAPKKRSSGMKRRSCCRADPRTRCKDQFVSAAPDMLLALGMRGQPQRYFDLQNTPIPHDAIESWPSALLHAARRAIRRAVPMAKLMRVAACICRGWRIAHVSNGRSMTATLGCGRCYGDKSIPKAGRSGRVAYTQRVPANTHRSSVRRQ